MCLWLEEVLVMSGGLEMFISHATPVIESRAKDLKEWPETIYMRVGYVFLFAFFRMNGSTDFYDFWHPQ